MRITIDAHFFECGPRWWSFLWILNFSLETLKKCGVSIYIRLCFQPQPFPKCKTAILENRFDDLQSKKMFFMKYITSAVSWNLCDSSFNVKNNVRMWFLLQLLQNRKWDLTRNAPLNRSCHQIQTRKTRRWFVSLPYRQNQKNSVCINRVMAEQTKRDKTWDGLFVVLNLSH